jgi:hypothetical protein
MVQLVQPDLMALMESTVQLVHKEIRELTVLMALTVPTVLMVLQVPTVPTVLMVLKESKVQPALRALKAFRDCREFKEHKEFKVLECPMLLLDKHVQDQQMQLARLHGLNQHLAQTSGLWDVK